MLMDKLDNDAFAAAVFTHETELRVKQREASGEDEKREIAAKGMFHYFDDDHSNDIDAREFAEGMRKMAHDMERFARVCFVFWSSREATDGWVCACVGGRRVSGAGGAIA